MKWSLISRSSDDDDDDEVQVGRQPIALKMRHNDYLYLLNFLMFSLHFNPYILVKGKLGLGGKLLLVSGKLLLIFSIFSIGGKVSYLILLT